MRFEYEITEADYVAAQSLYFKILQGHASIGPLTWLAGGLLLCAVAWNEGGLSYAAFLLAGVGVWWIYWSVPNLFPSWTYRRAYRAGNFAGKRYIADVGEQSFEVEGDVYTWRVRWQGVEVEGENKDIFILGAANTIFMFGKKYLSEEQQQEIRRLSGLGSQSAQTAL